ncbi:spectrin binding protein [Aureococcus anophagefferens]|uniref:Spectrin binding protein n=1 Tax=Aureococcus anophagefferens TaxID=44056 RepID=A0ABR1GG26_AURAN
MGRRAVTPRHGDVIAAATAGDLGKLQSFDRAAVAGAVDKHGCTALHWAAGGGFPDCVAWLVDEGLCAVDAPQQTNGRAPLHFAARNGRVDACRCIVDRCGGRVDPRADADVTPIQLAAWQLRLEVLEYLESAGADPARVNGFGCTAAHWVVLAPKDRAAVPGLHLKVARWLEARLAPALGDCWRLRNAQGHEPLHKAAFSGHSHFCAWLREAKGILDSPDDHGNYAADLARETGHEALSAWLRTKCAPSRAADLAALRACAPDLGDDPDDAELRRAFRSAALASHPDRGGDAAAFDRAKRSYERLARGVGAQANPLRDAATVRRLLADEAEDAKAPAALAEFEARLAVVLLEQPGGLALGSLRKRYGRAWPDAPNYFPEPADHGYRKLAHLIRHEAARVARVVDEDNGNVVLYSALDKAGLEHRLLELEEARSSNITS